MRILGSFRKNQGFGKKAAFNKNKPQGDATAAPLSFFQQRKASSMFFL
jgi:hypothetical protein